MSKYDLSHLCRSVNPTDKPVNARTTRSIDLTHRQDSAIPIMQQEEQQSQQQQRRQQQQQQQQQQPEETTMYQQPLSPPPAAAPPPPPLPLPLPTQPIYPPMATTPMYGNLPPMNGHRPSTKTLKIVILGDSGVGKTCLLQRYCQDRFSGQYKATIGADFLLKQVVLSDVYGIQHLVTLQLWDTAGQERFQSLGVGFYRGADAALLVYDITDTPSLLHLQHWKNEFLNHVGGNATAAFSSINFPFLVVGNKCDKTGTDRKVPTHRALEWCQQQSVFSSLDGVGNNSSRPLPHYEASAKTGVAVEEAFTDLARLALQYADYKQRMAPPQLFVPPGEQPGHNHNVINLRRQNSSTMSDATSASMRNDQCC
jgi:Ras-related protein Rab-7A